MWHGPLLHYNTLHCTTVHYTTLHYTTLMWPGPSCICFTGAQQCSAVCHGASAVQCTVPGCPAAGEMVGAQVVEVVEDQPKLEKYSFCRNFVAIGVLLGESKLVSLGQF